MLASGSIPGIGNFFAFLPFCLLFFHEDEDEDSQGEESKAQKNEAIYVHNETRET